MTQAYNRWMTGTPAERFTLQELAQIVHDAEECDDDVTYMEAIDEVFLVRHICNDYWRDIYNEEWKQRAAGA